jgi:RNA polymerase sigma factor (sigma-70 family)
MVKDSIQDVFIDLYEHRNQLSVPDNIKFYLFKALKRTLFRRLKKERKFGSINERNDLSFQTDYSIEKETINVEIENYKKKLILHTLKTLTRKQQEILYLKFTMGFDYQEISQILGIDNNSVRKQVYRAIKRLRESQLIKELKTIVLFKLFGARVAMS